jgi:hypothetical protein
VILSTELFNSQVNGSSTPKSNVLKSKVLKPKRLKAKVPKLTVCTKKKPPTRESVSTTDEEEISDIEEQVLSSRISKSTVRTKKKPSAIKESVSTSDDDGICEIEEQVYDVQEEAAPSVELCEYEPKVGDYVISTLVYNFGTRKEFEKKYVGVVTLTNTGRQKDQFEISFLRKQKSTDSDGNECYFYKYPPILDKYLVTSDQVVRKVDLAKVLKGKHFFLNLQHDEIEKDK